MTHVARNKRCKVFVSYSRHDEALVQPLAGLLGAAAGDAVFLDTNSIRPGDSWKTGIEDAVRASSVFILCWCCEGERSDFIAHEIKMALDAGDKRLIPVLLCSTPLPPALSDRQWVDLRGRVVHSCNQHRPTAPPPLPPPGPLASPAPYRSKQVLLGSSLATFLVFAVSMGVYVYPRHSLQESTLCLFQTGPEAGRIWEFSPAKPLPVGSQCQNSAGSTGIVIEPNPPMDAPTPKKSEGHTPVKVPPRPESKPESPPLPTWLLTSLILAAGILVAWLYKTLRSRQRRSEANKVAAVAMSYFEQLTENRR